MKNVDERIGKCSGKTPRLKQSRKAQRRRSASVVGQEAPGRTVSASEKAIEGPFGDHTGYYKQRSATRCSVSTAFAFGTGPYI